MAVSARVTCYSKLASASDMPERAESGKAKKNNGKGRWASGLRRWWHKEGYAWAPWFWAGAQVSLTRGATIVNKACRRTGSGKGNRKPAPAREG
jgi:hypothetical protein